MSNRIIVVALTLTIVSLVGFTQQKPKKEANSKPKSTASTLSYKKDIAPIFKKYCLPCHTEDQMNPSELYLDNYANMMKGGKHGSPIIAAKPDSSIMVLKLSGKPPFGDPMPYKAKRPFPEDTLALLKKWISQGSKNN